MINVFFLK